MLRQKWLHYSVESHLLTLHSHINPQSSLHHPQLENQYISWAQGSTVPDLNISAELPLLLVCVHIPFIGTAKYLLLSCPCSPNLPHKSHLPMQRVWGILSPPKVNVCQSRCSRVHVQSQMKRQNSSIRATSSKDSSLCTPLPCTHS